MKRIILLVFLLTRFNYAWTQTNAVLDVPKLILPAPNAFSFTKYGDIPVGLFTGTMSYSLPLINLQTGKINLPISLDYTTNGVKVDEVPGRTGLSWALQSGGVITRNIVGKADDALILEVPGPITYNSIPFYEYMRFSVDNGRNTQPDEFSYNFAGYSGRFYFDENGNAKEFSVTGNKIEKIGNMLQFKITTPDGFEYTFGPGDFSESYSPGQEVDPLVSFGQNGKTSWYLTRIKSTSGDEMSFKYSLLNGGNSIEYLSSINETNFYMPLDGPLDAVPDYFITSGNCGAGDLARGLDYIQGGPLPWFRRIYNMSKISMIKLDTIDYRQGYVKFYYGSRQDVPGDVRLDSLILFRKSDSKKIKVMHFKYIYSQATGYPTVLDLNILQPPYTGVSFPDNHNYLSKRLFLQEVVIVNPDNYNDVHNHKFEYDNINQLPWRVSFAQDFFGYFNGKINSGFTPKNTAVHLAFGDYELGSNREVDTLFTKKGTLSKIIYPTGGSTVIKYENNTLHKLENRRIYDTLSFPIYGAFTPTYSSNFNTELAYKFEIEAYWNGAPIPPYDPNVPVIDTMMYVKILRVSDGSCVGCMWDGSSPIMVSHRTQVYSGDLPENSMKGGGPYRILFYGTHPELNAVVRIYQYDTVTVELNKPSGGVRVAEIRNYLSDGSSLASMKKFNYNTPGSVYSSGGQINDFQDARDFFYFDRTVFGVNGYENVLGGRYIISSSSGIGGFSNDYLSVNYEYVTETFDSAGVQGSVESQFIMQPNSLPGTFRCGPLNTDDVEQHSHRLIPGVPYSNTGPLNGKEFRKIIYKNNGGTPFKIKETTNYYSLDSRLRHVDSFYAIRRLVNRQSYIPSYRYFGDFDINFYERISTWTHLDSVIEKEYDHLNTELVKKTINTYGSSVHLQPTEIKQTSSQGKEFKTRITYPSDVPISSLVNRNFLVVPVKNEELVNSTVVTTKKMNYDIIGSYSILPTSLQTSTYANSLETDLSFDKYDARGNVREFTEKNVTSTLLTDTIIDEVVAGVQNALADHIAYNSFESAFTGNWTGYNPVNAQTGGVMGTKYYQQTGFSLSKSGLINTKKYYVTYWSRGGAYTINGTENGYPRNLDVLTKGGDTWTLYEHLVSGQSTITVSGNGGIDELRLYPENAQMTTYAYIPLVGQYSVCTVNNSISYFEYDAFNRLKLIRDQDGKIVKQFDYQYNVNP